MQQKPFSIDDVRQGDYVSLGEHGSYYVNDICPGDIRFRITDQIADRYNQFAEGWAVRKEFATALISREESAESEENSAEQV